jgi:hypothetical protein
MKKKIMRRINKKVSELLVEWLKNIVDEEEQKKITIENYEKLLPKDTYFMYHRTYYLSFYTTRWVKQGIKKLYKKGRSINSITIKDLEWNLMKKNQKQQSRILS